jgi:hypothetical protein
MKYLSGGGEVKPNNTGKAVLLPEARDGSGVFKKNVLANRRYPGPGESKAMVRHTGEARPGLEREPAPRCHTGGTRPGSQR